MSEPALHICLFGSLELVWGDEVLPPPSPALPRSLLAYLVFHHSRAVPRDRLVGLFWPERPDARARRALSQALWQVRTALGPAANRLTAEQDAVSFSLFPGDRLDVAEFERLADGPDLQSLVAAVDLHRADFLEGIYDDWALLERERLRECYLGVLGRLIALYKQQGSYEQALVYAQRLAAADPLREEVHRELMQLYHLLGRSQAALEQFAVLRAVLDAEIGLAPSHTTVALSQEIARDLAAALDEATPPHLPVAPPPPPLLRDLAHLPLVGRVGERGVLLDALQGVVQGQGGVALVEGDAGVGKTRLVGEIVADARWRGFQVGQGKAEHLAASPPYQLLCDALVPLLTPLRIAQLAESVEPLWFSVVASVCPVVADRLPDLPPLASLEPHEEQQRLWEGVARCLSGLAAIAPLVLILEDVHWADEATLGALVHLAPRVGKMRAFVILTARTAEDRERESVWQALESVDRASPLLRLRLEPFVPAETAALVTRALGVSAGDASVVAFAERLQDGTGGNALFLVESLKSLVEQGVLVLSSGGDGWCLPTADEPLPTPPSVQGLISRRLARLDALLRDVLELAAVLGEDADFPVLSRAGALASVGLPAALEALRQRGLLIESEAGYRFEHDRVRQVAYEAIEPEYRQRLHHKAGLVLEEMRPGQIESLAYHFDRAEVWDKAAIYGHQAGDRARAAYANDRAVAYYTQALKATQRLPGSTGLQFDLYLAREATLDLQGERAAQAGDLQALQTLSEQLGSARQAEVALRRANYAEAIGDYPAAIAAVQFAIDLARAAGDVTQEAAGYLQWGRALFYQGDYVAAEFQFTRALSTTQHNTPIAADSVVRLHRVEAESLHYLGGVHWLLDDYVGARRYYEQALLIYQEIDDQVGRVAVLNRLGVILAEQGNYTEAKAYYEWALPICGEIGYRYMEGSLFGNLGIVFLYQGDYTEASSYFEQSLRICREVGRRRGESMVLAYLGLLFHHLGDDEIAQEYCRKALLVVQDLDARPILSDVLTNLGHALVGLGYLEEAAEAYCQALDIRRELGEHNRAMESLAGLARVSVAQGHLDQALVQVEEILDRLANKGLAGADEPFRVYLTCYRVLEANSDYRAQGVLITAHDLLQEWAANIRDVTVRRSFLENVAAHREIVAAYRRTQENRVTVRLPRADAPTTRPLRDDEWIEVTWTPFASEDSQVEGKAAQRHHRLLRLLHEAGEQSAAPSVADLAVALGVTSRTVKRDLAALRAVGHDARTRGSR
jgi:predicted ATPase/DNA-binding SARP family transcriptional activator/biotin operon repressor